MHSILRVLEENTPHTSAIVNYISKNMKGNTFHHHYHILYTLRTLIEKDVCTYTEVGTFNGGSLCLMLQHESPVKCVSIDPFHLDRTSIDIVQSNISTFNKYNYSVELTRKFSTDPSLISELRDRQFTTDILFIDGDHTYTAVINDFNTLHEFVSPGGFIVFDDYHDRVSSPEVKPAVDTIVQRIKDSNMQYEVIGSPENYHNVYPSDLPFLNEFILRKV